ncbi:sodium channel protein Nach-like [Schistocerca gregaria]|uniref:sodium channel protein Nach-like n=1 Tax=Schistocerca gregaria TaxID=7010 RepID=UPI00211ECA9C|nr:sodium channel protein Nach-like [Schistocerca gregaria]
MPPNNIVEGDAVRRLNLTDPDIHPSKGKVSEIVWTDFNANDERKSFRMKINGRRTMKIVNTLSRHLSEFCKATTLHGLKYITEEGRHWFERLLWLLGCAAGATAASILINLVWSQYITSPTITTVESTHYPIWNVPYPAVTVCNINKVHLTNAVRLYEQSGIQDKLEEDEYYGFVQQLAEIIQPEKVNQFQHNISELEQTLQEYSLAMETLMLRLTQPCSSLMVKCKWRGEITPCNQLFTMQKSDSGFCCSFNYYPPDVDADTNSYLRVNGAGYLTGLTMLMDPRLEDYYAALFSFYGVQVLVHSPQDYPDISARGLIIAPQKEAFLQITAESTYSTPAVRTLNIDQRQCLFEDESGENRNLGRARYSYGNCVVYCRMEHLRKICNCTPYFYPSTGDTRQCGLLDVKCLAEHRRIFTNLKPPIFIPGLVDGQDGMSCDCHPSCTDINYRTELSQGQFFKSEYDRTHFFHEINITNHSILHVYFKDISSIRYRREVAYSWNDLLAAFGGIVGLCLGCSLLSLLELLYFFTLRPACKLLKDKSANTIQEKVYPFYIRQSQDNSVKKKPKVIVHNWLP